MLRRLCALLLLLGLGFAVPRAAEARLDPEELRQDIITSSSKAFRLFHRFLRLRGGRDPGEGRCGAGQDHRITLPLGDIEGRFDLGDLAFTVTEAGDRLYRISEVEAASQAAVVGEKGERGILINYDLERLEGIWSAALRNFLDLDLMVSRFEAVVPTRIWPSPWIASPRPTGHPRATTA